MVTQEPSINCYCHFCGSLLRFQISRVGETVNCLNCSMETVLFIPGLQPPYPQECYRLETREIGWGRNKFGVRQVSGTIANKSERRLDWVRVEFILYNQQAMPIGSTSDSIIELGPGAEWKFNAPVSQSEAKDISAALLSCEYGRVANGSIAVRPHEAIRAAGVTSS